MNTATLIHILLSFLYHNSANIPSRSESEYQIVTRRSGLKEKISKIDSDFTVTTFIAPPFLCNYISLSPSPPFIETKKRSIYRVVQRNQVTSYFQIFFIRSRSFFLKNALRNPLQVYINIPECHSQVLINKCCQVPAFPPF